MKARLALTALMLLSCGVSAQKLGENRPLPVTPQLRTQLTSYALQVAKRPCGSDIKAEATPNDLSELELERTFNRLRAQFMASIKRRNNGSTISAAYTRGQSGYMVIHSVGQSPPDFMIVVSRQQLNGVPHVVQYSCDLK